VALADAPLGGSARFYRPGSDAATRSHRYLVPNSRSPASPRPGTM
jgi:hypothetical protein